MRRVYVTARGRVGLLAFFMLWLAACSGDPTFPSPTAPPSMPAATTPAAAVVQRATLPPTWTLTPTRTALPPSATPTITPVPTLTPTLTEADRCASFALLGAPEDGLRRTRRAMSGVSFTWDSRLPDSAVQLRVRAAAGERVWEVTTVGPVILALPVRQLAGPGAYRWTVGPLDGAGALVEDCAMPANNQALVWRRSGASWSAAPSPGIGIVTAMLPDAAGLVVGLSTGSAARWSG